MKYTTNKKSLLIQKVLLQFQIQGQEPTSQHSSSHPDPIVRRFFRAAQKKFSQESNQFFEDFISTTLNHRPDIVDTHLANLWFRATQHLFTQRQQFEYQNYTEADWVKYFSHQAILDFDQTIDLIKQNNTATHIPQRYRSLSAALRLITKNNPNFDLRIGDIGCSLGLGLKASLTHSYLSKPEFIDNTPDKFITGLFDHQLVNVSRAVGIDIKIPTVDWVKSCNYPTRYHIDSTAIDQAIDQLSNSPFSVEIIESDILNPDTVKVLNHLNIIYSSITLYELTPHQKKIALKNISQALSPNGFFIELTFIDSNNWFKGVSANIYQKKLSKLSSPLNWLVWTDSRCNNVRPGKDFMKANQLLIKIDQ